MELKNIANTAVIVIVFGIVVILGLAVLGGFSNVLRTETTTTDVIVVTALGATNVSANIAAAYPYASAISDCTNQTRNLTTANYTFQPGTTANAGVGSVSLSGAAAVGSPLNCTIVWGAATDAQASADLFITGMGIFATFIAIIVLAIIAILIISLFKKQGQ